MAYTSSPTSSSAVSTTSSAVREKLNRTFESVGVPAPRPSEESRPGLWQSAYGGAKMFLRSGIQQLTGEDPSPTVNLKRRCFFCIKLLRELGQKFPEQVSAQEKYKILTCIPTRFTHREVMGATGCSMYLAREAKHLVDRFGAFSYPAPRKGKSIPKETSDKIIAFYVNTDNVRESPRQNDAVICKDADGNRVTMPKLLLLDNLNDFFSKFCLEHPTIKVSIATVAKLRPKNCVWPGRTGQHTTCVCEIHQNFQFLLDAIDYRESISDFINKTVCVNKGENQPNCHLGFCTECPSEQTFADLLQNLIEDDEITYQQWIHTDSTEIKSVTVSAHEFRTTFVTSVQKLIEHDYITRKQSMFLRNLRNERVKIGLEAVITVDFAQNYSFVVQNAVQVRKPYLHAKNTYVQTIQHENFGGIFSSMLKLTVLHFCSK